jgi:cation:H+ antiporter
VLTFLILILGFIFLIKGASLLVDGASSIAKQLKLSNLFIGLTIVAFGTSAPELVLNIIASFQEHGDLALGNIIGSNIANVLLIGGIAAIIYPIKIQSSTIWKEIPLSLLAFVVLFAFANDQLIDKRSWSIISRIDGIVLIAFFLIFLYYTFSISRVTEEEDSAVKESNTPIRILKVLLGAIGLALGGKWIIDSATTIAQTFGLSESLIGLTILAIGTSLPEVATTLVAALKKNSDLAIGNIVGSSIFNIFFVLGVSASIRPIVFNPALNTDIAIGVIASLILYYFVFAGKEEHMVEKKEGVALITTYVLYLGFLIWRG